MRKLRVGIIGLGVGEQHIAGYESHPGSEVASLCDFDVKKLNLAREKYPRIKCIKEAGAILDGADIDIVSIASYDNYHYRQVKRALSNGKHVFVEKPLCLYEREARDIRRILEAKPCLRLSSNLVLRASPRFIRAKELIEQGRLGKLFSVEGDYEYGRINKITEGWRGRIGYYSSVLGGGVHMVDLLLWLTKEKVTEVAAYGNNIASRPYFKYNDMVVAIMRFKSGLVGKVAVNFGCVRPHFHRIALYGTKATFLNACEDNALLFTSRDRKAAPKKIRLAYPGVRKDALIASFVDSILTGSSAAVTEEDVFRAMSVCFAIEKSAVEHKPVKVAYI